VETSDSIYKKTLSAEIVDLVDIFDQKEAGTLSSYNKNIYAINLDGSKPLFRSLYNLSASELEVIRTYIDTYLAKG
jgi:hypothetical protein